MGHLCKQRGCQDVAHFLHSKPANIHLNSPPLHHGALDADWIIQEQFQLMFQPNFTGCVDMSASDPKSADLMLTATNISLMVSSMPVKCVPYGCFCCKNPVSHAIQPHLTYSDELYQSTTEKYIYGRHICLLFLSLGSVTTWGHGDNGTFPNEQASPKWENQNSR